MESRSLFLETGGDPPSSSVTSRCRALCTSDTAKWVVSPVFIALLMGWALTLVLIFVLPKVRLFVFFSGLIFWLVSLALHEWAHAFTAYRGGDRSVADKGYLNLDITRYVDPMMSLILPCVFLLMGGFALPGGAVYVQPGSLRSKRWETAVSLAGPLANFVCALFAAVLLKCVQGGVTTFTSDGQLMVASTLALCAYFQVMASFLNLLPLPPLDGWGALSPWLPEDFIVKRAMRDPNWSRTVSMLTLVIIFVGVSRVTYFGQAITSTLSSLGVDAWLVSNGMNSFKMQGNPLMPGQ
eukprot:GDKI01013951.1.p1 GENE.GDKI01013951.1~~GDKI01013951.1.p1  ORF type:complete len:296 (-),score=52.87 GDKI01013951.1:33-920(-)